MQSRYLNYAVILGLKLNENQMEMAVCIYICLMAAHFLVTFVNKT